MAPEVLLAQNHSYTADFFAIGVMLYEFMLGERPYSGRNRKEIREDIMKKQAYLKKDNLPSGWNIDSIDFINLLLMRKPIKRLGYINGIYDLKNHKFFKGFNWDLLENKKMKSPFIPDSGGNFDKTFCEKDESLNVETLERYQEYICRKSYENLFYDYTYINEDEIGPKMKNIKIINSNDKTDRSNCKVKIKKLINLKNPSALNPNNFNNNDNYNHKLGNPFVKKLYIKNNKLSRNFSNLNIINNNLELAINNDSNINNSTKKLVRSGSVQQFIPKYNNYGSFFHLNKKKISNLDEFQISNILSENKRNNKKIFRQLGIYSNRDLSNSNSEQTITWKLPKIHNSLEINHTKNKFHIKKIKKKIILHLSVNNSNYINIDRNNFKKLKKSESANILQDTNLS